MRTQGGPAEGLPFLSRRSVTRSTRGMVACSQPLAAAEGLAALREGATAADAAVVMAAVLCVVEPMSTGPGGDAFALCWNARDRKLRALNASGRAGADVSAERLRASGMASMPLQGGACVTVPGAVSGWAALLEACGSWSLERALAPAIRAAEEGFAVTELIAGSWARLTPKLESNEEARRVFLPGGRAPRAGERFANPDLARTLAGVARGGAAAFYRGPLAEALVEAVRESGGFLTAPDLERHSVTWDEPLWAPYRGLYVVECPPNGQGLAALLALRVAEGFDLRGMGALSPAALHVEIEAMRLGFADAHRYIADPAHAPAPLRELLSEKYSRARRALIQPDEALPPPAPGIPAGDDTVYLCDVDQWGNQVSFIQSLYHGFGSGVVARGTGVALQSRGAGFSLEPGHPNELAPGRRPYHTIIPGMLFEERPDAPSGRGPSAVFGVMGGPMQPQGHLQVVTAMADFGLNVQQALELPRFRVEEDRVCVEPQVPGSSVDELRAMGHRMEHEDALSGGFGGGQIIRVRPADGTLEGGSDPRKDGQALGY